MPLLTKDHAIEQLRPLFAEGTQIDNAKHGAIVVHTGDLAKSQKVVEALYAATQKVLPDWQPNADTLGTMDGAGNLHIDMALLHYLGDSDVFDKITDKAAGLLREGFTYEGKLETTLSQLRSA